MKGVDLYDPAKSFDKVKHIGAVPWEGVVEAIDSIGAPSPRPAPEATPAQPTLGSVSMIPADHPLPAHQPLSTEQPTAPAPIPSTP